MKKSLHTIIILTIIIFTVMKSNAQTEYYKTDWMNVEKLIEEGRPTSALKIVKDIYQKAKAQKQDAQVIKSLMYITQLQDENREDNLEKSIKEIEDEITQSTEPAASILRNYLATLYWEFFQDIRYKLYNRTNTPTYQKDDIATWSAEDFHKKITELYLASLQNSKQLQQTKLEPYDALIQKGNSRHLRPTLFDLLAHEALDYFENDEIEIIQPENKFEIKQADAFAPATAFANTELLTTDSTAPKYVALLIYQKLIRFHLNDPKPDALIDVDLKRLQFVRSHFVVPEDHTRSFYIVDGQPVHALDMPMDLIESVQIIPPQEAVALYGNKALNGAIHVITKSISSYPELPITTSPANLNDILYYHALKQITQKFGNIPATAQAYFLMAEWHADLGKEYTPNKDTAYRYERIKAREITAIILKQQEKSEGWVNAYNLKQQLLTPQLSCEVENVNIPDLPFRMLIRYKNIQNIHLRIISANEALKKDFADYSYRDSIWSSLLHKTPIRSWAQELPKTNDLQEHLVEIKIDPLPIGEYFIIASIEDNFSTKDNILAAALTHISNISYVTFENNIFVLHRNTGHPLSNTKVHLWQSRYNYTTSKQRKEKVGSYITNKDGQATITLTSNLNPNERKELLFEIEHENDRLFLEKSNFTYYSYSNFDNHTTDTKPQIFLFTDRSIYRPGQTVYFKGLVIKKQSDGKKAVVYEGYKDSIILYSANGQKVSTLQLTTNEYGTFSGQFTLPASGLNGLFSIRTKKNYGNVSFRVEEYKRPKFYVEFEAIKEAYKVNDEIKVTGFAKAYAGNNISGAQVKYRIVREVYFPYPWLLRSWFWPRTASAQIAHGTTSTDDKGFFQISFTALPDLKLDKKTDPVFHYKIYVDVTDINGETRSGSQYVSAGYKSILLKTTIDEKVHIDSLKTLHIRTENMAGNFVPTNIQVTITELIPEQRLLRPRYWEKPDQFAIDKATYVHNFPNDIYDNEDDPNSWKRGAVVLQQSGMTEDSGIFTLHSTKAIQPGRYALQVTTQDSDGNEIKDVRYIEIYGKQQHSNALSYIETSTPRTIEPGEKANIEFTTAANDIFLIKHIQKEDSQFDYHKLNNGNKTFVFAATENDRGGYGVNFVFVKHNRLFKKQHTIVVPWSNKELKVEYSTFRDKTLPGSEEQWTIKISGNKKEKVLAEVMASMYDASLDQFYPHHWKVPYIWNNYYNRTDWTAYSNFKKVDTYEKGSYSTSIESFKKEYDRFIFISTSNILYENTIDHVLSGRVSGLAMAKAVDSNAEGFVNMSEAPTVKNEEVIAPLPDTQQSDHLKNDNVQIRTNFNETAFFFPKLKTDKDGNISFTFTIPEALTKWKFQALAHTKDLAFGYSTHEIITQKDLMVQPNPPRFLREGDKLHFSAKVVNLSDKEITGIASLQLFDAETYDTVDGWFKNVIPQQYFTLGAGESQAIQFPIEVPYHFNKAIAWRIIAKTDSVNAQGQNLSDGEENILPVLTNRMLVTEAMPLHMRGNGSRTFKFDKLINSSNSETLTTQSLTIEYTSNPVWYAVQALPYMMEYPYECSEQTWNRYFANALAHHIVDQIPKIKEIFEHWQTQDSSALLSNLHKNETLKSILLEETPWVLAAKNESQQKKNIALLFDLIKMNAALHKTYEKLKELQTPNGGFAWFKGGLDNLYITQYILTGIGHLKKLKAVSGVQEANLNRILQKALPYVDARIKREYDMLKESKINLERYTPSYIFIHYLYMRSFFPQNKIPTATEPVVKYLIERAQKTWTKQNKYMQAMIALALHRNNDQITPKAILKSLDETAIRHEELGMYYKNTYRSWWWYEAPIETQSLIIEAFEEITKDSKTADDLRTWLLKNKQTNKWESTKATAEAVYALLLRGSDWTSITPQVSVALGNTTFDNTESEAGTGYFQKVIEGYKVRPDMGNITVNVEQTPSNASLPTWGSVYWQYFEDLDKITTAATPLQLNKKLFIERNTERGPVLMPITVEDKIKVGDKIKVRIELKVDRDMEFVHMKDMRASALEPVNVLSQYKWQGGLGYYETTKDAGTHFFFDYLPKGTYVFEYSLHASVTGNFSNGITSIQCMYAPEFTAHSEGMRITIE